MESLLQVGAGNALAAALLALPAAIVGRLAGRPALAHGLWLLVLLKLIAPPLVRLPMPMPSPGPTPRAEVEVIEFTGPIVEGEEGFAITPAEAPGEVEESADPSTPPAPAPARPDAHDWWAGLGAVWLGGTVVYLALTAARVRRFGRVLRHAEPAPDEVQFRAEWLAEALGLARCPDVRLVPGPVCPMLWAIGGRPRLLLPSALWGRMTAEQRDALLVHELAHLRRRDHWVRLVELAATALFWWNPVAWWARRELREAEEQCCDAWVVWALPKRNRAYANALLDAVDFLSGSGPAPLLASGMGQAHHLKRRLLMIKRGETPRALGRLGRLAVLGLAAALLPLLPSWAQDPKGEEEREVEVRGQILKVEPGDARFEIEIGDDDDAPHIARFETKVMDDDADDDDDEDADDEDDEGEAEADVAKLKAEIARLERDLARARKRLEARAQKLGRPGKPGEKPKKVYIYKRRIEDGQDVLIAPGRKRVMVLPPGAPLPPPAPGGPAVPGGAPMPPPTPPPPGAEGAPSLPPVAPGEVKARLFRYHVEPPPGPDQERRLRDLEKKVDQILNALDGLKRSRAGDRPEGEKPK